MTVDQKIEPRSKRVMKSFVTRSPEETEALGESLAEGLSAGSVVAIRGELGAGKTVLAKGIARGLGVSGYLKSPSFTIINEYSEGRIPLYHIDLYRLPEEGALEAGGGIEDGLALEEYLYGDGVCIIEWAERAVALIPDDAVRVTITYGVESEGEGQGAQDDETARTLVVYFSEYEEPSCSEGR